MVHFSMLIFVGGAEGPREPLLYTCAVWRDLTVGDSESRVRWRAFRRNDGDRERRRARRASACQARGLQ